MEIYVIISATRQFGYQKMNLPGVKLGERGSKTLLGQKHH
jgi:hypothetical protein